MKEPHIHMHRTPKYTQLKHKKPRNPCVEPGEVPCDVCTGTQLKTVKSCLVCFVSYCHNHLEPHQTVARLKKHLLVEPMDHLEDGCFCTEMDHKTHPVVPLKEEYEVKMVQLGKIESEVQQMIHQRDNERFRRTTTQSNAVKQMQTEI
ncbi:Tripartite motif-containing protein 29 [Merluccius polli]|uniref:Tripartite motif-containing protein 29 n=1 Tax=Merluccius polli TaxID=89951 RepID=A0AA47N6N8_MERPO|nr:Tripartite motif-containing protein 29 [Merluccius polli]